MMGLLSNDFEDPRTQGILALGLGLLGGRGNFGQALSQAGAQGIGAYQGARQNAAANELRKMQMAQMGLSMKASQQDIDQRERLAQLDAARREAMSSSMMPGGALPMPATMDNRDVGLPGEPSLSRPAGLDMLAYANRLAAMGDPAAIQVFASLQKDQPKPFTRKRDEDLLVPDGQGGVRVLMQGEKPPEKVNLPASVQEYQFAVSQGFRGSIQDWVMAKARAGATSVTTYGSPVPVTNADGTIGFVQPNNRGGVASVLVGPDGQPVRGRGDESKPLTEGQAKAVLFASRMEAADQVMNDLAKRGTKTINPGSTSNSDVGDVIGAISSPQQQQVVQARRDFVNAVLRRESGAVISPDEFANAERQYFPQIGDRAEVVAQKARARRSAIEGMKADIPRSRQDDVPRISQGTSEQNWPGRPATPVGGGRVVDFGTLK